MTTIPITSDDRTATWEKPGAGTWELDRSHVVTPGPMLRGILTHGMDEGMAEGCAWFGAPIAGMQLRWVNGRFYRRIVPLVGGDRDVRPPPAFALKLATRLVPAFRRAEKRASESIAVRRWREEIARWEDEWRPGLEAANRRLAAVDPVALDDAALADHVAELHEQVLAGTKLHFRLHVSAIAPMGLLMIRLGHWGLDPARVFEALVHASPATRGPAESAAAIAAALRSKGTEPATVASLDDVRAAGAQPAQLLDEHIRTYGWRLTTGYDLEDRTLVELPGAVLASIRNAGRRTDGTAAPDDDRAARLVAALRDDVPDQHRIEFDELVTEARESYGLRDENGPLTYQWPAGLLRRALLTAGERLADEGRLSAAARVFELTADEVSGLLRGGAEPTASEIDQRADERRWWATLDPPLRLGPEEEPPPLEVMPPALRLVTEAIFAVMGALEAADDAVDRPLTGLGIGDATHVATARVVDDAGTAFDAMEPGDVLVAPFTSPTYNAVLAIAGAVVTDEGGLLCHAAVIARELGLPAVIGAVGATTSIPDGATVEVDPVAGRVRVLATAG